MNKYAPTCDPDTFNYKCTMSSVKDSFKNPEIDAHMSNPKISFRSERDYDPVDHPAHYTSHPSGIECIQVTEHMGFNLGNAVKYIWRADLKNDAIEDLRKAKWYIERELQKRGVK